MPYWQDVRYALRLLRKSPVFTLLTIIVLGGGLGISIFTFSFLYTAMLRPLPVSDGERIVRITEKAGSSSIGIDAYDFARMRSGITTLTDLGAFTGRELVVADDDGTHSLAIDATASQWNIFKATRTSAALGRGFRPDDEARGAEPVVVLSYRTWQAVFGGDSTLVGERITLDGRPTRVIGVMPRGYGFPVAADAWVPLGAEALSNPTLGMLTVEAFARLAPGVSSDAARAQLQVLAELARRSRPLVPAGSMVDHGTQAASAADSAPIRIGVESFPRAQMGDEGPLVFTILNLLAALILLLACVNVVNLLGLGVSLTTGVLVSATIVGVVLAAAYLPTRRALGVAPREALWRE